MILAKLCNWRAAGAIVTIWAFIGVAELGIAAGWNASQKAGESHEQFADLSYVELLIHAAARDTGYTEQQVRESQARLAAMRKDKDDGR
jgi:hypothetical protein